MSVPVIAFFNNKSGVGKTTLVYHLAHMFSDLGTTVLAADLDPQAKLTMMCLDEDAQESLWEVDSRELTIYNCIRPLIEGMRFKPDGGPPTVQAIKDPSPIDNGDGLLLLPGDLLLAGLEETLSSAWAYAHNGNALAFRVLSAFGRVMQRGAAKCGAFAIPMDLGSNLGSINRAALIAADYVVIPLSLDLLSLQGLRSLGSALQRWREQWLYRFDRRPGNVESPPGRMEPLGYTLQQPSIRFDLRVKSYDRWIGRIPGEYRKYVLNESGNTELSVQDDPHKLALLQNYRSLVQMAEEARKPMFHLKPADGAIGSHLQSVHDAYRDFQALAKAIASRVGIELPELNRIGAQ